MPGLYREAKAPVLQEDAGCRFREHRPETCRVGLDQRDAHAIVVDGTEIDGAAAGVTLAVIARGRIATDAVATWTEHRWIEQGRAVGLFMQHLVAIERR